MVPATRTVAQVVAQVTRLRRGARRQRDADSLRTLPEALDRRRALESRVIPSSRAASRSGVPTPTSSTPRSASPRALRDAGLAARRSRRAGHHGRGAVPDGVVRRVDRRPRSRLDVRRRRSRGSRRAISSSTAGILRAAGARAVVASARARRGIRRRARERVRIWRSCCRGDDLDAPPLEPDDASVAGRHRVRPVHLGIDLRAERRRAVAPQSVREHRRHQRSRRPRDHLRGFRA